MKCPRCFSENVQVFCETDRQGFSGKKGCCGWFLFGPIGVLCGLCGKNKIISEDKYWLCNNCGAKFNDSQAIPSDPRPNFVEGQTQCNVNPNDIEKADNEEKLTATLFDLTTPNFQYIGEGGMNTVNAISSWINKGTTYQDYIKILDNYSMEHSEWATQNTNASLLGKVKEQVVSCLDEDEVLLFYKDSGVFNKGKSGILITNKKIITTNKGQISYLNIADISSLHFVELLSSNCMWYFNFNNKVQIDNVNCTPFDQGLIIAFICTMAREYNLDSEAYRIRFLKGNL